MDKIKIRNWMLSDIENPAAVNAYLQILLRTGGKPSIYTAEFSVYRSFDGLYEVNKRGEAITKETALLNIIPEIIEYFDHEISRFYDDFDDDNDEADDQEVPFLNEIEEELSKAKPNTKIIDNLIKSLNIWLDRSRTEVKHYISWNDEKTLDF